MPDDSEYGGNSSRVTRQRNECVIKLKNIVEQDFEPGIKCTVWLSHVFIPQYVFLSEAFLDVEARIGVVNVRLWASTITGVDTVHFSQQLSLLAHAMPGRSGNRSYFFNYWTEQTVLR